MTLGQRIQEQRKQRNLSQEALGEALGVSRQAISKWESDLTIPEIDKLIALSKLFGLPVGQLLGVEEPPGEGDAPEELSPREVELVNTIARGYLKQSQASRTRRDQRNLVLAVVGGVLVLGAVWFGAALLNRHFDALAGRIANVEQRVDNIGSTVDHQMSTLTADMEAMLKDQSSLVEEWSYTLDEVAYGGLCSLTLSVTPREYVHGSTRATLSLTVPGEDPVFDDGEWNGQSFCFDAQLPAVSQVEARFSLWVDGVQQIQVLSPITDLAKRARLNLKVDETSQSTWHRYSNSWEGTCDLSLVATGAWADEELGIRPEFFQLRWEKNGEIVDRQDVEVMEVHATRFIGETHWERKIPLEQDGDEYALRYYMRDSLGQVYQGELFHFEVVEGKYGLEVSSLPLETPPALS